ncbi:hypothetical protein CBS101457_006550 [Exobasidium rhododendri]|nr:hypothetical protein CBS101457_006550 [Exobasidium rhododendri]
MIRSAQPRTSFDASSGSRQVFAESSSSSSSMATGASMTPTTSNLEVGLSTPSKPRHSPSNSLTRTSGPSRLDSSSYTHCSFCLVAEFDIDKGSTLSYQYPAPINHDEHMLAELMLPDGVHARSEDWTVFFLAAQSEPSPRHSQQRESFQLDEEQRTNANAPKVKGRDDLIYVLNLVRTKHDNTVRRGALVKAIAIGTRHPFIQVFKPALLLALDDYYKSPSIDVLMRLYDSLNSLDLTAMPRFSRNEKLILRSSDRMYLFDERFKDVTPSRAVSRLRNRRDLMADSSSIGEDGRLPDVTTRPRSDSASTTKSSAAEDHMLKTGNSSSAGVEYGRSTPHLLHRPSLASLRPGSSASGILKRRPSAAAQLQLQQFNGLDGSYISLPNNASAWRGPNGAAASSTTTLGNGKVKDTHYWESSVTYGKIQDLPIRIPTDVFSEEVGEYSLINLITTFASSTPIGPLHPHLHSNGQSTSPIILLFNAIVTEKRIVFLGHNQPASRVASHVLSACALGSGCGSGWRGIAKRCFPYANLGIMEELEKVPGYIAGVTNPRFEDLHAWDLLFNIESGKITIAKDIESAASSKSSTHRQGMPEAISCGSLTSNNGYGGSDGSAKMRRAPSEPDILSPGASSFGLGSSASTKGRDRSAVALESRMDAPESVFMEEILQAVSARFGEKYIRSRFADWTANFLKQVARHEEHFYGQTSIAPKSQPYLNGQLGSGFISSSDRETEMKEITSSASRIEAFRATECYATYCADEAVRNKNRSITGFDLHHQLARLRKAKRLPSSECELIFSTIARSVKSSDQIIELLSLLPAHQGGLFPFSCGLLHSSMTIRVAAQDLLITLTKHPLGKKFVQTLNTFHRLAFARQLHESREFSADGLVTTPATTPLAHQQAQQRRSSQNNIVSPQSSSLKSRDGLPHASLHLPNREGLPAIDQPLTAFPSSDGAASPAAFT